MTVDQVMSTQFEVVTVASFEELRDLVQASIVRAVARVTSVPLDLPTHQVVTACFDAFFDARLRPRAALKATLPLMAEFGAAQACQGRTNSELDAAFVQIHRIVMGALNQFTGGRVVGESMLRLRRDVKCYLDGIYRQLVAAVAREHVRQDRMVAQHLALAGTPFDDMPRRSGRVRVLVATGAELPVAVLDDPRLMRGRSSFEVLVPEQVEPSELEEALAGQVVVGPLTGWAQLDESASLGWRAATLLRDGRASDPRRLVPCTDLLHAILVSSNSVMTELLADKHLRAFDALSPRRRRELSAFLLAWLERGVAGNALARQIGIPPQTVHHRLNQLRELLGESLDDPGQRLELIVALRATQPEWSQAG